MRISDWSSDVCSSDLIVEFAHERGNLVQPRALRRAPAPFTRDELIALAVPLSIGGRAPHDDRLEQPAQPDRIGEFGDRILVEVATRLPRQRANRADRDMLHRIQNGRAAWRERGLQYV